MEVRSKEHCGRSPEVIEVEGKVKREREAEREAERKPEVAFLKSEYSGPVGQGDAHLVESKVKR